MGVSGANGHIIVTKTELARYLGVTAPALDQHIKAGRFTMIGKGYALMQCIQAYCEHLRGAASGRGGAEHVASLTEERARLASAQAEMQEMKNAALRGETVQVSAVEAEWDGVLRLVRSRLLSVPSRVRARLGHIGQMEAAVIDREIRDALTELGEDIEPDASAA